MGQELKEALHWCGIVAVDTEPKRTARTGRCMTIALIAASAVESDKRTMRVTTGS